jgi:hypothetical protein
MTALNPYYRRANLPYQGGKSKRAQSLCRLGVVILDMSALAKDLAVSSSRYLGIARGWSEDFVYAASWRPRAAERWSRAVSTSR